MTRGLKTKLLIISLLITGFITALLYSPEITQSTAVEPTQAKSTASNIKVLDVPLLDQNGTNVKFASDVVGNNIVAMNFIYTDCKTACPVVSAIFAKLQNQLGDKLQQNVRLVSLSINPNSDTPANLKEYATHLNARPEWIWLTGEKKSVDELLKALGVYDVDYTNHTPVILIGDAVNGLWTRFDGFTSPETLAAKIDELLAYRKKN